MKIEEKITVDKMAWDIHEEFKKKGLKVWGVVVFPDKVEVYADDSEDVNRVRTEVVKLRAKVAESSEVMV